MASQAWNGKKNSDGSKGWTAALGVGIVTLSLTLALGSYNPQDPSFSSFSSQWSSPKNVLGYFGSWTADIAFQVFGYSAWLIPSLLFIALGRWLVSSPKAKSILNVRWWAALALVLISCGLFADLWNLGAKLATTKMAMKDSFQAQGLLGIAVRSAAVPFFGIVGSYLLVGALLWCFCMMWWEELPGLIAEKFLFVARHLARMAKYLNAKLFRSEEKAKDKTTVTTEATGRIIVQGSTVNNAVQNEPSTTAPIIRENTEKLSATTGTTSAKKQVARPTHTNWSLPSLSLLLNPKKKVKGPSQDQLIETAKKITSALKSFEVDGEVVEISPGPIITMYEFQPAPGIRVQKIMSASTDLAMTLGVASVRIVAPIPGKSVAGIEVPNAEKDDIVLRDVFEQTLDRAKSMRLPLVLGKDGEGRPVVEDLARMPHLLIGGATSMGKSVLVNSILTGLLCRFTPEELRLVIVDPKLVEFKVFEDIPHLLLPIVNDPNDASQALKWAVVETKRRYVLMQKYSAKNLEAYNEKVSASAKEASDTEEKPERFPHIVIIIDELAELMLTAKKDVEQSIVRLTQLARAAGIHLIMATQRPSADVVTGLIKSNCPSRAALRVASSSDSRIILDCTGAEQLIGRGDMFFTSTGPMGLRRMQSCFVSDQEIEKVCDFWRAQGEPEYKEEILAPDPAELMEGEQSGSDPLYNDVIEFAREKGQVSTSLIQRRFQIGYTRAARIMEQLEERGIVGEQSAAGRARDVLI